MRGVALALLAVAVLGGCKKKGQTAGGPSLVDDRAGDSQVARPEVIGPVHWWDETGLCLDVPEGWKGVGLGKGGVLLTIENPGTGVRFEIYRGDAKADRADLMPVLKDEGSYRDIPALGLVGIESWTSDIPGGEALHVWTATVKGTPIRIEARYPFGKAFTGMLDVETLLTAICVE